MKSLADFTEKFLRLQWVDNQMLLKRQKCFMKM